jgi:hypothetical protein
VQVVANPSGGFDVLGSHTYLAGATGLTFRVAIQDHGGASASASASINVSRNVVITGTSGNDSMVVSPGVGVGSVSYTLNGGPRVLLRNVNTFTFNGGRGRDTMTVNLGPSNPLLPSFIKFNGGRGSNTLVVNGSRAANTLFITQPASLSGYRLNEITAAPSGANQIVGRQVVTYTSVHTLKINNAAAINGEAGPRTGPRSTVFRDLNPQERAVQAVYLADLGRAGSKTELDSWLSLLPPNATSLNAEVVTGIANSLAAQDHLVKSWYIIYLGRQPQNGEELGWVGQLHSGVSEAVVLSEILGDPINNEFYNRAQTLISSGTPDQRYVQALHELLQGRAAAPTELANASANLAVMGRGGYALSILQGQEFRDDQFDGYYNSLLHMPVDQAGLDTWAMSNLDLGVVLMDFEARAKFFVDG